jgi:hypothetical protein
MSSFFAKKTCYFPANFASLMFLIDRGGVFWAEYGKKSG